MKKTVGRRRVKSLTTVSPLLSAVPRCSHGGYRVASDGVQARQAGCVIMVAMLLGRDDVLGRVMIQKFDQVVLV